MFNRIEKLLATEYENFKENILVESPFTQVSESGKGIRAVTIGEWNLNFRNFIRHSNPRTIDRNSFYFSALTQNNLIIATDVFLSNNFQVPSNVDPEIETLELIKVIPTQHLHYYLTNKNRKFYLKVSYKPPNGPSKTLRFEFNGHLLKFFYFNLWMEKFQEILQARRSKKFIENSAESKVHDETGRKESSSKSSLKKAMENSLIESLQKAPVAEKVKKKISMKSFVKFFVRKWNFEWYSWDFDGIF